MTVPNSSEQAFNMAYRLFDFDTATKYSVYVQKKLRAKKYGRTAYKDSTKTKVYESEWAFQKQVKIKKFADYNEARKHGSQLSLIVVVVILFLLKRKRLVMNEQLVFLGVTRFNLVHNVVWINIHYFTNLLTQLVICTTM